MNFVIKCSKCHQIGHREIRTEIHGKLYVCPNCKKGFTLKKVNKWGLQGNTFGPYKTPDEAMHKVAAMKALEQKDGENGFVTYKAQ